MIGRTLDRYRIESMLGEGAMGVVFAARDTRLNRLVAIKVLPPDAVASANRTRRFVQEAKAASALNHPGIVVVHDIGSDDGVDFIVMEYLAGRTLDRVIPAHGLPIDRALRYAVASADAVAAAHGAGIVHRDLKPSNVMVTDDDRIKVLDFGLAKLLDVGEGSADATRSAAATASGTVLGSAAYMSPEQAEGRAVDARSDVFSFGVMLYEMVTGRRPFVGETALATITRILHDEPVPPSQLTPSVSPKLDRIVLRSLRKDRERRFQSMADMKVALQDLAPQPIASPAVPEGPARVRRGRWPWVIASAVLLLAAGVYLTVGRNPPRDDAAALVAVPITSAPGTKRSPSFSVDGTQVAYSWSAPIGTTWTSTSSRSAPALHYGSAGESWPVFGSPRRRLACPLMTEIFVVFLSKVQLNSHTLGLKSSAEDGAGSSFESAESGPSPWVEPALGTSLNGHAVWHCVALRSFQESRRAAARPRIVRRITFCADRLGSAHDS